MRQIHALSRKQCHLLQRIHKAHHLALSDITAQNSREGSRAARMSRLLNEPAVTAYHDIRLRVCHVDFFFIHHECDNIHIRLFFAQFFKQLLRAALILVRSCGNHQIAVIPLGKGFFIKNRRPDSRTERMIRVAVRHDVHALGSGFIQNIQRISHVADRTAASDMGHLHLVSRTLAEFHHLLGRGRRARSVASEMYRNDVILLIKRRQQVQRFLERNPRRVLKAAGKSHRRVGQTVLHDFLHFFQLLRRRRRISIIRADHLTQRILTEEHHIVRRTSVLL